MYATLHEQVAAQVISLIEKGTLRPGERIPSVRQCSRQMQVSISTVKEAYRRLEDAGRIEARPQSGYYVRHLAKRPILPGKRTLEEPRISQPLPKPTAVTAVELGLRVLRDTHQENLIPLGAATPNRDLLPLAKLGHALATAMRGEEGNRLSAVYDVPPGCMPLRRNIARRLVSAGCAVSPEEIVTTTGCQEAIHLCLRAVCRPGDVVAVESPVFFGILQAIESMGLKALEIPTHPRTGISLEALEYALGQTRVSACLVVTNHSNPLGSCLLDEHKIRLVRMLAEHDVPLIEDDVYGDLGHGRDRPNCAKAYDRDGNVLLCSSFSKTISPAYRVGYVVPGRFQRQIEHLKFITNIGSATPTQLAVAHLLGNGGYDLHLRRVRRIYRQQVALMTEAIGHYFPDGTRVSRPTGGYVLWVELPTAVNTLALYDKALRVGISIAPGPLFSAQDRYHNCLRMNAAYWSPRVEEALETLGRLITHG